MRTRNNRLRRDHELAYLWHDADTNAAIRGTRWAGYQAITEYLDHHTPVGPKRDAARVRAERAISPATTALKSRAFDLLSLSSGTGNGAHRDPARRLTSSRLVGRPTAAHQANRSASPRLDSYRAGTTPKGTTIMTEPAVTVEHIDPATLLVDVNIRTEATLDRDFLASIRDLGVLIPIVAVRTPDGALRVRHGHRRTLAAVHHGLPAVRVVVVGEDDADEVNRIVSQWHENEYRAGLSTADKLAAVEQLSLLGLSAGQIVKRTKASKTEVEHALSANASALAKGAADRYEFLTLDQAAAVAEFEIGPATS